MTCHVKSLTSRKTSGVSFLHTTHFWQTHYTHSVLPLLSQNEIKVDTSENKNKFKLGKNKLVISDFNKEKIKNILFHF